MTSAPSPTAGPAPGKRERTRQKLIEVAAALIREKGFPNVTMEEVAARAGVSRGSIYGNFRDRDALIAAVAAWRTPQVLPMPVSGAGLDEQLRTLGQMVAKAAVARRHDTVYWAGFMLHALSDETLRRRAETMNRAVRQQVIEAWSKALPADQLPVPADTFVKLLTTLSNGLIMAHSMSPDDFGEDVIVAAFEALGTKRGR